METNNEKKPGETAFVVILVIFSLFLTWQAYGISGFDSLSSPGSFPMAVSFIMVISSIIILLKSTKLGINNSILFWKDILPKNIIIISIFILIFALMLQNIGFLISAYYFLSGSIYFLNKGNLKFSLGVAFLSLFIIYILFHMVFSVIMPEGIIPEREIWAWLENFIILWNIK